MIAENKNDFLKNYQNVLMIPSYHDLNNENSYHMMMLGMCLCLSDNYKVLFIIEKKVKEDVISLSRLMMKRKHRLLLNLSISKKIKKILKKHWINYQMKLFNKSKIEDMIMI